MKKIIKATSGFTLVELIVVIAILGILAGAGTVAYSGYVTRANKSVDQQTVANLIYAVKLADYANPELIEEGTSLYIATTENKTLVSGSSDADALTEAIQDSMGSLDNIKMQYADWSGAADGTVLQEMVTSLVTMDYLDENGNILVTDSEGNPLTASYASNADELWNTVVTIADYEKTESTSAASYVAQVANITSTGLLATDAAGMGTAWATADITSQLWSSGSVEAYAVAKAAVLARNYAFAEYLSENYSLENESEVIRIIRGSLTENSFDTTDRVRDFYTSSTAPSSTVSDTVTYLNPIWSTLHMAAVSYISSGQAKADGMIYYALMYNINEVTTNGTYNVDDDDYLDNISAYVSIAGTAMSGSIDFQSMYQMSQSLADVGTYIGITMTKLSNGGWKIIVNPTDAYVTSQQEDNNSSLENDDETEYTKETINFSCIYLSSTWRFQPYPAVQSDYTYTTTETAYKITISPVAGNINSYSFSQEDGVSTWTKSENSLSGSISISVSGTGISVADDIITVSKGASGSATITFTASDGTSVTHNHCIITFSDS